MYKNPKRTPDFQNLEAVLNKQVPKRPVLFEFILGDDIKKHLTDGLYRSDTDYNEAYWTMRAFYSAGYDFSPIVLRGMEFPRGELDEQHETKSINDGGLISDWPSYRRYSWPDAKNANYAMLDQMAEALPEGMRLIPFSHDGILENTIGLVGYERLCLMLYDNPELLEKIFASVGRRIRDYFVRCLAHEVVGAVLLNDDWGFKSQTMLPPDALRKHVFPWYAEIAEEAHKRGKYVILHSCGNYEAIVDDIVHTMNIDAKQSYEDNIVPVEEAYENLQGKIAVIGGIDMDFLCRATPEEVYNRSKAMIERTKERGGFALGSGNSVPDYVPIENYHAMLDAAFDYDEEE